MRLSCALVVLLLCGTPAHAALDAYLHLTGDALGQIVGDGPPPDREGLIKVIGFVKRQTAEGLEELVITKEIDKSTPLLMSALTRNERFSEFRLDLWTQRGRSGEELRYVFLTLENARITKIRQEKLDNRYPQNSEHKEREHVSFYFSRATSEVRPAPGLFATVDFLSPVKGRRNLFEVNLELSTDKAADQLSFKIDDLLVEALPLSSSSVDGFRTYAPGASSFGSITVEANVRPSDGSPSLFESWSDAGAACRTSRDCVRWLESKEQRCEMGTLHLQNSPASEQQKYLLEQASGKQTSLAVLTAPPGRDSGGFPTRAVRVSIWKKSDWAGSAPVEPTLVRQYVFTNVMPTEFKSPVQGAKTKGMESLTAQIGCLHFVSLSEAVGTGVAQTNATQASKGVRRELRSRRSAAGEGARLRVLVRGGDESASMYEDFDAYAGGNIATQPANLNRPPSTKRAPTTGRAPRIFVPRPPPSSPPSARPTRGGSTACGLPAARGDAIPGLDVGCEDGCEGGVCEGEQIPGEDVACAVKEQDSVGVCEEGAASEAEACVCEEGRVPCALEGGGYMCTLCFPGGVVYDPSTLDPRCARCKGDSADGHRSITEVELKGPITDVQRKGMYEWIKATVNGEEKATASAAPSPPGTASPAPSPAKAPAGMRDVEVQEFDGDEQELSYLYERAFVTGFSFPMCWRDSKVEFSESLVFRTGGGRKVVRFKAGSELSDKVN